MATLVETDIRQRMARMYRPQKYIYDLTRLYYLLGRDRLIAELNLRPGQSVLDIGCGTGAFASHFELSPSRVHHRDDLDAAQAGPHAVEDRVARAAQHEAPSIAAAEASFEQASTCTPSVST